MFLERRKSSLPMRKAHGPSWREHVPAFAGKEIGNGFDTKDPKRRQEEYGPSCGEHRPPAHGFSRDVRGSPPEIWFHIRSTRRRADGLERPSRIVYRQRGKLMEQVESRADDARPHHRSGEDRQSSPRARRPMPSSERKGDKSP